MPSSLTPFFKAAGVAVIGASSNPRKLSFGILRNLVQSNYKGGIYPVNPGSSEILGKPCFADFKYKLKALLFVTRDKVTYMITKE